MPQIGRTSQCQTQSAQQRSLTASEPFWSLMIKRHLFMNRTLYFTPVPTGYATDRTTQPMPNTISATAIPTSQRAILVLNDKTPFIYEPYSIFYTRSHRLCHRSDDPANAKHNQRNSDPYQPASHSGP